MFTNYIRISFRKLRKNQLHSFLNIAGLSAGMAVAILIGLWIKDELSFNKQHANYDRIAVVKQNLSNNGSIQTWGSVPYPLAEELRKNYGGDFTRVVLGTGSGSHILTVGDKNLNKPGSFFENGVVEMLSLHMLKGNGDALKDPGAVLLSESVSKSLFGDDDPMNKMMRIDNKLNVTVAGIYEDLPENATLNDMGFIAPWQLYFNNTEWIRTAEDPWRPNAFLLFTQLTPQADFATVSEKIKDAKLNNINTDLAKKQPKLFLHPMGKWHLYAEFKNGVNTGGRIQYVWLFGIIGVFVLLLACINFMNLSTARSEKSAKEVGIRKAIGSRRGQLVQQFFSESIFIVVLSFFLSFLLVQLVLPFFNGVAGKKLSIPWTDPVFWAMGLGFTLISGLLAGSYPALYLSSFQPVKVLKGTFKAGRWAAVPRKVLVVVQFSVSVVLIIGTIVVFRQVQFAKDRPVGYDQSGLISIPMFTDEIHQRFDLVKTELLKTGLIQGIAEAGSSTTAATSTSSGFDWRGKDPGMPVDFPVTDVSHEYGKTIGWQFVGGRDFSTDFSTDTATFIINESAAAFMELKNPVGETIRYFGQPFTVIGVVKDMITQSPYEQPRPAIFFLSQGSPNVVIAKLNPASDPKEAIAGIEQVLKKFSPAQPFEYQFVEDVYGQKFGNEERIARLAGFFAALAIFISCLGLFGMASFMAEQRIKEIGVRKVIGASVFSVWRLLSKDFILLVILSLVIAIPAAYYIMNNWLQGYQYHAAIAWWIFAAASVGAVLIALLTVTYQSLRAAFSNPVKSLRAQ